MTNARPEQVGTGVVVIEPGRQSHDTAELGHSAVVPLPLPWARAYIENVAGAEIPEYGTAEFHALEDGPVKVASCVLAAERWRTRRFQPEFLPSTRSRRAREIAEARRPRPGDYLGGPVEYEQRVAR